MELTPALDPTPALDIQPEAELTSAPELAPALEPAPALDAAQMTDVAPVMEAKLDTVDVPDMGGAIPAVTGTSAFPAEPSPNPVPASSPPSITDETPMVALQPASYNRPPRADLALELLSEVATAMQALMSRCQTLETSASSTQDKARAELNAARETALDWQRKSAVLQEQMDRMEQEALVLHRRTQAAEKEVAAARSLVESSHKAAAEAECLSSLFSEKVISSFGVGSPGHSILETVRNRTQQLVEA